ncbi:MAG: NAD(P)/FAD-dependent oxidoreductase [Chitinophagaceae bacterium]
MKSVNQISILGAGLVGSLLAILLKKRGFQVSVFERREDMRKASLSAGKSINLAMSLRGWKALEKAGLRSEIEKIALPMYGRLIHQKDGNTVFQQYGTNQEAIYSVSRGELNIQLMNLAEKEGVEIKFNHKANDVQVDKNIVFFENEAGQIIEHSNHDLLIAADGAFSALRDAYRKTDRYQFNQFYIEHGYKELNIPSNANGEFQLEHNALHIWPRKNFMLIALPNIDASFTCTLFLPFEGEISFEKLKTRDDVLAFFETEFPDALKLMPTLIDDFFINPTSSLVTIKCFPWVYQNKSMLIGDAAHAIVPFYGQGMNAGFEDCSLFTELLDDEKYNQNIEILLKEYENRRKINGDAVADLALHNFIEMRDLVADEKFLERKKIEKELYKLYPNQFISVYEMVSFSHKPYSYALQCMQAQDRLLTQIMNLGSFSEAINNPTLKIEIDQFIQDYSEEVAGFKI